MTRTAAYDSVVSERNGIVENRHELHGAVVDSTGRLLLSLGNPSRLTLIRSAAKPLQALAVAESGALERYGFDEADLALVCASHSSEDGHVARARAMLGKAGVDEGRLRCGGHPSIMPGINRDWIKNDVVPTAVWNNCSGKHAGVLAAARAIGADVTDYNVLKHPMQARISDVVGDLTGLPPQEIQWGVDGCNMAAPALALDRLGYTYSLFAQAADDDDEGQRGGSNSPSSRTQAMARIFNAMTRHPEMVAGDDRFCTVLMKAFQGHLVGKVGADGVYAVGVRESEQTRRLGARGALGISVKIEDGNLDVLYAAVAEILEQLCIGTPKAWGALLGFRQGKIVNTAGVVTGGLSFPFRLRAV